jgi:type II secretory pathway pseudopilin PulG
VILRQSSNFGGATVSGVYANRDCPQYFILLLLLLLAVPSLSGVIANRRLKQSLEGFNQLVRQAQERSVTERRAYLIVWGKSSVALRPEVFTKDEEEKATSVLRLPKGKLD